MRFAWVTVPIVGAIIALSAAQLFQIEAVDAQIARDAAELLHVAVAVADESNKIITAVNDLPGPACAPSDLRDLRFLAASSMYVLDAGRYRDGRVDCTGLWGVPVTPLAVSTPDHITPANVLLWQEKELAFDRRLKADVAVSGNAILYMRSAAFHRYDEISDDMRAIIVTSDGGHIFRGFGREAPAVITAFRKTNDLLQMRGRHATDCDERHQICVIMQKDISANVFARSPLAACAILLLGALAGAGGGFAIEDLLRTYRSMDRQLRRALKRGRFRVAYQPIVSLGNRQITGVEALARWNNEDGQAISPEVFIARIEKMGLLPELTNAVIIRALSDLQGHLTDTSDFYVSINVGVTDLLSPDFTTFLLHETKSRRIDPRRIALEITERASADMEALITAVVKFRSMGFRIFIDDFGTGYSGLAYLASMPVDVVKVDRMFTSAVGTDSLRAKMFGNICSMINEVSGNVLVEGVETSDQADQLQQLLPDASAQGWFFGKPMEDISALAPYFQRRPSVTSPQQYADIRTQPST